MDVTPNVCEEGNPEGQYGTWMVVRRKRNGYKGPTSGKSLEGTSVLTQNSPLPPSPNFSGRTSMTEYGPKNRACSVEICIEGLRLNLNKERQAG